MSLKRWLPGEEYTDSSGRVWRAGHMPVLMGTDRSAPAARFDALSRAVRGTWRQRFSRWLGNKLIQLGARLGGDDW